MFNDRYSDKACSFHYQVRSKQLVQQCLVCVMTSRILFFVSQGDKRIEQIGRIGIHRFKESCRNLTKDPFELALNEFI